MGNRVIQKFDNDYVSALRRILELAVENIAEENRTPATKAKMAETILQRAADGMTDLGELMRIAVHEGQTPAA